MTGYPPGALADRDTERSTEELDLAQQMTLLDLVDRVLDKGVVLAGDFVLSVADVDLVYLSLRAFLASAECLARTNDAVGRGQEVGR